MDLEANALQRTPLFSTINVDRLRGGRRGSGEGGRSINDEDNERIEFDQETMEMMRAPQGATHQGKNRHDGGEGE